MVALEVVRVAVAVLWVAVAAAVAMVGKEAA